MKRKREIFRQDDRKFSLAMSVTTVFVPLPIRTEHAVADGPFSISAQQGFDLDD